MLFLACNHQFNRTWMQVCLSCTPSIHPIYKLCPVINRLYIICVMSDRPHSLLIIYRWRELVVGGSSVHDTNRNSISMPSTPMTPVTPSSACATTPDKPDKAVIDQPTAPCCGPTEPVPLASSKSSSNSLQELEVIFCFLFTG